MPAQPQQRQVERRRVMRQKSFLRGAIILGNRHSVLDYLIRDISPYGARLILSDPVSVPDVFELNIPQKEQIARAHVIWRHGSEVGVAFAQHVTMDEDAGDGALAERVQRLEAEVASLKRALRQRKVGAHEFEPD